MIRTQQQAAGICRFPSIVRKHHPPHRADVKLGCCCMHVVELISTDQCQYVKTAYRMALNR